MSFIGLDVTCDESGRTLKETVPAESTMDLGARTATVLAGGAVRQRIRLAAADGVKHWFDV